MQRPDGRTVVAELGVVVVLGDDRVAPLGPLEQRAPAARGESTTPVGNWCAGVSSTASGAASSSASTSMPSSSTGIGTGPQAAAGDDLADHRVAGILDADRRRGPSVAQHRAEQPDRLREAAADERVLGGRGHSAHAAEVRDERGPQRRRAAHVAVGELEIGRGLQRGAVRA